ncbi:MAG: serine/threonine protein kinase [Chthoniobacterales bacterium]
MEQKIFLGKYRLRAGADGTPIVLRRTTTGCTYHAEEIGSGRDVAVKLSPSDSLNETVLKQLEAEATAAKQMAHINVPAVYDFGVEDGNAVYVTEYFEGTTVEDWVAEHGPMPVDAVLRVALQILGGLGAAAFQGIVHHAINPSNVMIVPGQTADGGWPLVKLLHLIGVAPKLSTSSVSSAAVDNSANFASPEQLETGAVDFASEIYSLGSTLVFLLTGTPPVVHADESPETRHAITRATLGGLSGVPKNVTALLEQMLALNPDERPRDPLAFYGQIEDAMAQLERREEMVRTFGIPPASIVQSVDKPPRRPVPVKALAIAAAFLLVSTFAALILPSLMRHNAAARSTPKEEIGVPVGVPESANSPVVATSNSAQPLPAQSPASTTRTEPAASAGAQNVDDGSAPALVSTDATSGTSQSAAPAPAVQKEQSNEIAAKQLSQTPAPLPAALAHVRQEPRTAAQTTVESQPTPVSSAEQTRPVEQAPDSATTAASVAKSDARNNNVATATTDKAGADDAVTAAKATKKRTVKKTSTSRSDGGAPPPVPPGTVRAEFVGTTPDGEWIFGLPSSQTGVAVPGDSDARAARRRHRVRRAIPVPQADEDEAPTVLRAVPVDE